MSLTRWLLPWRTNCDKGLGQEHWRTAHEKNVCAVGVLITTPSIARRLNYLQRGKTNHCSLHYEVAQFHAHSCLTFATRMTKNAFSQMNQVDTSPLRDHQTAGWTFVGLVVVDELVRFRNLQLLHAPCTSCCMSPSPVCCHLSDPVVLVHPRRLIRVSTIFHCGFFHLSSHCRNGRHYNVLIPTNVGQWFPIKKICLEPFQDCAALLSPVLFKHIVDLW